MNKIELGMNVRDKITGFEGMATAKIQCITGCLRIQVSPKAKDKDVIPSDGIEIDETMLEIIDNGIYSPPVKKVKTGAYGRGR